MYSDKRQFIQCICLSIIVILLILLTIIFNNKNRIKSNIEGKNEVKIDMINNIEDLNQIEGVIYDKYRNPYYEMEDYDFVESDN